MSYADIFAGQWDRLVNDFKTTFQSVPAEGMDAQRLAKWYRSNAYRWSGLSEAESKILTEQNDPALRDELVAAIQDFRFTPAPAAAKPNLWAPGIGAAAAAVVVGIALKAEHRLRWWTVLIDVLLCGTAALYLMARRLDEGKKTSQKAALDFYVKQLKDYKPRLVAICRKHEAS